MRQFLSITISTASRLLSGLILVLSLLVVINSAHAQQASDLQFESLNLQNQFSHFHALTVRYVGAVDTVGLIKIERMKCKMAPEPKLPSDPDPKIRELIEKADQLIGRDRYPRAIVGGSLIVLPSLKPGATFVLHAASVNHDVESCAGDLEICFGDGKSNECKSIKDLKVNDRPVASNKGQIEPTVTSFSYRTIDTEAGELFYSVQEIANGGDKRLMVLFDTRDKVTSGDCELTPATSYRIEQAKEFGRFIILGPHTRMLRIQPFTVRSATAAHCEFKTDYAYRVMREGETGEPKFERAFATGTVNLLSSLVMTAESFGNVEYDYEKK